MPKRYVDPPRLEEDIWVGYVIVGLWLVYGVVSSIWPEYAGITLADHVLRQ